MEVAKELRIMDVSDYMSILPCCAHLVSSVSSVT